VPALSLKEGGTDKARRLAVGFEVHDLHLHCTTDAFIKAHLKKIRTPVTVRRSETLKTRDCLSMKVRIVDLAVKSGTLRAMMGFVLRNKQAFVLYGYTDQTSLGAAKGEFAAILQSLRFPSAQELAAVHPPSPKVIKARRGDTW